MFGKKLKTAKVDRAAMGALSGVERTFGTDELIVTKTDLKGHITYANDLFCKLAGYEQGEALGAAHALIRHPHMPKCVFKLLWDTISSGKEIFAYVINRSRNGDHYWVLAHVTPSFDNTGKIVGYHSSRRIANPKVLRDTIIPLYAELLRVENQHDNPRDAIGASTAVLTDILTKKGMNYDAFVFDLVRAG